MTRVLLTGPGATYHFSMAASLTTGSGPDMNLWKTLNIALVALKLNALRSFLTMLGIIIGIASVIVMVSVSSGSKAEIERAIDQLGSNMLSIRPGARMSGGRHSGSGSAAPFTEKDIQRLKEKFAFLEGISGSVNSNGPI